jgi:hypothetical protein
MFLLEPIVFAIVESGRRQCKSTSRAVAASRPIWQRRARREGWDMNRLGTLLLVLALGMACGCESSKPNAEPKTAAKPVAKAAETTAKVRAPRPAVATGTLFSRVRIGQHMKEVAAAIGDADESSGHLMGKNFIPFYFGKDRYRTTWYYKGEGRIIFNTGARVMRIERDAKEDGKKGETPKDAAASKT